MKAIIVLLVVIALVIGGAYAAGVRFHPEVLTQKPVSNTPESPVVQKSAIQLNLKNGQSVVGEIVKETPKGVLFSFDGAQVEFTNDEIVSQEEVEVQLAKKIQYVEKRVETLFTYDPSKSLIPKISLPLPSSSSGKPSFAASTLWGVRPKTQAPAQQEGQTPSIFDGHDTYMGIVKKAMSPDQLQKFKDESIAQMNSMPRNPWIEARNASDAVEKRRKEIEDKVAQMEAS